MSNIIQTQAKFCVFLTFSGELKLPLIPKFGPSTSTSQHQKL